jgi:hypothetical protein
MDKIVLCAASYYEHKFYFNDESFSTLPNDVKREAQIIAATTAEKVRAIVSIGFYAQNGSVFVEIRSNGEDLDFDEIAAKYEVNKIQKSKKKFLNALSLWYRVTKLSAKGIAIK